MSQESRATSGVVLPFNPLDKRNLAASVAQALLGSSAYEMDQLQTFAGAGIYAIYYCGSFKPYHAIASQNRDKTNPLFPIYVGKAVPAGARKGTVVSSSSNSKALFNRLTEPVESIQAANSTLKLEDFVCRYLVVDDIWIPLGESLMIAKFSPVWNTIIDGFGNHDPGKGRYQGLRPRWDVVHPGRKWAVKCQERNESLVSILRDLQSYLANIVFSH